MYTVYYFERYPNNNKYILKDVLILSEILYQYTRKGTVKIFLCSDLLQLLFYNVIYVLP